MKSPRGLKELTAFYGNPNLWIRADGSAHPAWESQMVLVPMPYPLPLGWAPRTEAIRVRVHNKIAGLVEETFLALMEEGAWGLLKTYDGGYTWRPKRGSSKLSMHAFGAALDFNAGTNRLGQVDFDMPREVVRVFERLGWTWGGRWRVPDAMHFQFGRAY